MNHLIPEIRPSWACVNMCCSAWPHSWKSVSTSLQTSILRSDSKSILDYYYILKIKIIFFCTAKGMSVLALANAGLVLSCGVCSGVSAALPGGADTRTLHKHCNCKQHSPCTVQTQKQRFMACSDVDP